MEAEWKTLNTTGKEEKSRTGLGKRVGGMRPVIENERPCKTFTGCITFYFFQLPVATVKRETGDFN